ncbi:MAG: Uma2 family endonuclease [Ktedonobacteraceae bacterium]|nr:Uma2 family endonuclease [Ktedonobacteraceae bacterium]
MAKQLQYDELAYYYDTHPTEEDLLGETAIHGALAQYLLEVLAALFECQRCALYHNFNFYHTGYWKEHPVAPDIAVIKGVDFRKVRSWRVGTTGPAPQVVLEIASRETWHKDLMEKPSKYAVMGVEEYFAYDPNEPALRREGRRLFGWQLDRAAHLMRQLPLEPDGRLWSRHLDSFLVPEGAYLRLYDRNGQMRLTRAEAEKQRADVEAAARRAETRRADAGERRAGAEKRRADALAEKLRSLGIDPDQIEPLQP